MPKDILLSLCYIVLCICVCIATGGLLCMVLRLIESELDITIFPSTAIRCMSYNDENQFIKMYESDAIKRTFMNKRIYKRLTSSLDYQIRKYEENKCKEIKDVICQREVK